LKRRMIVVGVIMVVVFGVIVASCAKQPKAERPKAKKLQKIVVAESARGEHWLPVYLAHQLGYFKDEGLEVSFVTYQGGPLAIAALLAGDAQFSLTGYEQVLKTYEKGKSTKMIGATTQKHSWSLLVRPEIKTFADLKGKKISAGKPGSSARAFVRASVIYGGLNPDTDVVYVDLPPGGEVAALDKGEIDAAFGGGARKVELLKKGAKVLVDLTKPEQHKKVIGSDTYHLYVIQVTDEYSKKHPDIVQKFVNAVARGIAWQKKHTVKEIAATIAPLFPGIKAEAITDVKRSLSSDGYLTKEGHAAAVRFSIDVGMITKPIPFKAVVDNSFIRKAHKKLGK